MSETKRGPPITLDGPRFLCHAAQHSEANEDWCAEVLRHLRRIADGLHRIALAAHRRRFTATAGSAGDRYGHGGENSACENADEPVEKGLLRFYDCHAGRALRGRLDGRWRHQTIDERQRPRLIDRGGANGTTGVDGGVLTAGREHGEECQQSGTAHERFRWECRARQPGASGQRGAQSERARIIIARGMRKDARVQPLQTGQRPMIRRSTSMQ